MKEAAGVFLACLAISIVSPAPFGHPAAGAQSEPALPHRAEVVPGEIFVTVYAHDIPDKDDRVPCWSFVSEGFERYGQHELVLTLRRSRGKSWRDYTEDLFGLLSLVLDQNKKGVQINAYGGLVMDLQGGFMGQKGDWGLICIPAEMFDGVEVPFQALAAVLVRDGELEVMKRTSAVRVASMLGAAYRYYPCPPWSELGRKPVISAKDAGRSFLSKFEVRGAPGVAVRQIGIPRANEKKSVTLSVEGSSVQGLSGMLAGRPVPDLLALMTEPDPGSRMRYAWLPGKGNTGLIFARLGATVTGSYIAFMVGDDIEEVINVVEDGFALALSPASWARLKAAIASVQPDTIPIGKGGSVLKVVFTQTFPVDPLAPASFVPDSIGLAQPQSELTARFGNMTALKDSVQVFVTAAQSALAGADRGDARGLLVAVGLKPGRKVRIWTEALEGTLPEATSKKLDGTLARVLAPEVTGGPVAFVIKGTLWGREVKAYPDLPSAWSSAKDESGTPAKNLDEIFAIIWPDEGTPAGRPR